MQIYSRSLSVCIFNLIEIFLSDLRKYWAHQRSEVGMEEDVTVVVDQKRVAVSSEL